MEADKGGDREEKKEVGESAKPNKLVYVGLTKPKLKEIKKNPVLLRLVRKYTGKKREGEENQSSRANLENGRSQTKSDKGLTEYAGTDMISCTSTRVHSTNDAMRQNNGDEDKTRCAGTNMLIRQSRVERGLVNHVGRTTPSLASTSTVRVDYVKRRTVKQIREQDRHYRSYNILCGLSKPQSSNES